MTKGSLTTWIVAGMIAGTAVGLLWPAAGSAGAPLVAIFLRLIESLIAPLLFATLVSGMMAAGTPRSMGRVGVKALVYFQVVSTAALLIGFAAGVVLQPGAGLGNIGALETGRSGDVPPVPSLISTIERTFPLSFIDAMARGDVLQIVVFSLLFGAACAAIGAKARAIIKFTDSLGEVMFRYTRYVMYFAPAGVAAAMALTISRNGPKVLSSLGKFVLVECGAELAFAASVLLPAAALARVPISRFFRAVRAPAALAFSTASSDSALPLALENMERFGVPKHIAGFVLATGYSLNLAGTTLHIMLGSIFVAQAAGVRLSLEQQLFMVLALMLTSKGVAAVPRSSYVILVSTVTAVGVPVEAASIILGVDAFLDMLRTCVNLVGNCLATAIVAQWEGAGLQRKATAAC